MNRRFTEKNKQLVGTPSPLSQKVVRKIGPFDILCGRTSEALTNIGNRRFRVTIEVNLKRYVAAPSRRDKTQLVASIVDLLRDEIGARFLRRTPNGYQELEEKQCREKVGHTFRDMVASRYGTRAPKREKKARERPCSAEMPCPSISSISSSNWPSPVSTTSCQMEPVANKVVGPHQAQPRDNIRSCWIDSTLEQVFLSMCEKSGDNDFSLEPRPLLDCDRS